MIEDDLSPVAHVGMIIGDLTQAAHAMLAADDPARSRAERCESWDEARLHLANVRGKIAEMERACTGGLYG